ncbi:NitT/TauT family transport system ATP-binding protein [Azospirillum agricola]|uniref:ABC transporter ATP-binding protein n=1 Tax=Azospirillum agricola TaxID=1720247 RepID=UPI001AE1D041|nr:ABC transporter ATP-binding protein [Azospirillum agricola]MBP2229209.1 NitT/TauT family transport system ATP-binding protein [Azospirillum agricola]
MTTPPEPLIVCDRVGHRYRSALGRETAALSGVSLTIGADEFVCLLGPSGCGKTTLLNLIAGFLAPSEGEIRVGGVVVGGPSPERGVVFQDYSLFPWLTARGNVAFGPRMAGRPARERRRLAEECLALVGLEGAGDRYPFELSGGMKQRVAIAHALATEPALLLMDEPFAALDAMTRGALQAQILAIRAREARTILFVTHNIAEAIALGTRILVMSPNPGRIAEDIPVDLPYPRRRTAPAFNALYERLTQAIGLSVAD